MAAFHGQMDMACRRNGAGCGVADISSICISMIIMAGIWTGKISILYILARENRLRQIFSFLHDIGYSGDYTIEAVSFKQSGEIEFERMNNTIKTLRSKLYG